MYLKKVQLRIPEGKIENYLLNIYHPEGVFKALFFIKNGFVPSEPLDLSQALINQAIVNSVEKLIETEFGKKFIIRGFLKTPDKKDIKIISVWFQNLNEELVNLVTAYPNNK
jgi:hypothetical protein